MPSSPDTSAIRSANGEWIERFHNLQRYTANGGKGISNASFQVGIKTSSSGGTGLGGVTTEVGVAVGPGPTRQSNVKRLQSVTGG